ncbi:gamma-glutamyltransferase [Gammaproteobacteria bacterium]|nr:gamma-glutamyltransferase [Gammaproteobacteria bacterium]
MNFLKIKMILLTIFFVACSESNNFKYNGVVVTRHYLASDVGAKILEEGGNAFDSAIAVAFALAVVNPSAGNLGGGGFVVYFKNSKIFTIDYREKAPIKSSKDMYLNSEGNVIKGLSLESYLASGTPGTVAGLIQLHKDEASMPLENLIAPAIVLANEGFKLSEFQAQNLNKYAKKFKKNKEAEKIFVKEGGWQKGDLLIQKDLAQSLSLIATNGSKAFYDGDITKKILNDFKENEGIFIKEDFLSYKIRKLEPLCGAYKSYQICSMPPPSSGGIAIIQMLNILENFDIKNLTHNSLEYIYLLKNIMSFAYADRSVFLGDPDYFNVPVNELISKDYAKKIAKKIKIKETSQVKPGMLFKESDETTHFSIIDKWGNSVSNTYTLNSAYGSGIVAKGTGILMNNEMDDFSQKPGYPNLYGLVGSEANKIEPKKSPLSSMSPVIVTKNNIPYLITGSPGGSTIINSVFQEIINILDFEMTLEESSNKNRIHYQWQPDIIFYEDLKPDILKELEGDFTLRKRKLGEIQSILKTSDGYKGYSDSRRPDGKSIEIH